MKRILLLLFFSLVNLNIHATKHNHTDEHVVRYIKKTNELDKQFQEQLRNSPLWQNFKNSNIDWFVIFNENNQLPHRAFGAPVSVTDVFTFLSNNNFDIPSDIRLKSEVKNHKYINQTFVQYYNNLEVVNSKLYAKFSLANELISFGLDVFNDINISTSPTLNLQSAIASATSNISNTISNVVVKDDLKVLANPKYRKYQYHLVYEISFSTRIGSGPANYICYVDANNGELLMRKNTVMYEAPATGIATVSGEVYPTNPYDSAVTQNFKYLKAIDQSTNTSYYTDDNGDVVLPMAIGTQVRYMLEGLYANVQTDSISADIFQNLAVTNSIVFDNSNSTIQERTAYQAVNNIHDHLKEVFPNYTGLDSPMQTNIDLAGSCNAYYDGSSINFYAAGGGCNATGNVADVVYHEYGHAINGNRYNGSSWSGGMQNGGLNEGYADIWALSLTISPILGIGFYDNDPTGFVRRYDQNRKVYPQDLVGEVHADGEIIAGAFWDLYLNFGSMSQMLDLFKYTYDSGIDGPDGDEGAIYTDILLEVLYADDNDANLTNGTPNDAAIVSAFALHGITLLSNAVISHNPVSVAAGNTGINISASVGITYPWALGSADCYYRLNDANSWTNMPMSGTSSFTTTIPAQPNGTIVAYYISLTDNYGNESGVTPVAANLAPVNNANLPYFILVGYELSEEEDFDFSFGFWQTGATNDNATTGIWEIGSPIGSFADPSDTSTICQTDAQHTLGGFQCAFTGNAASTNDGLGTNDVDGGHTTLLSPYYDLTSYTNPAFSYYRWYTNSPASGANPGADWWQVLITDDGVNWHYVENNKSSDISWRKFAFRITDYVNLTNNIQLKFIASDSLHLGQYLNGGSLVEAAVDDLMLYQQSNNNTGCTDPTADNYDATATVDDGSCTYTVCNEDAPTGLFVDGVIHSRAVINWDNMNSSTCTVDQYRIRYRAAGTSSWTNKTMGGPVGSCTWGNQRVDKLLLGLTGATTYEYEMKAWYCGGGASSWTGLSTFTTADNCPNVGNLTAVGANPTKATFTWDASNGSYEFLRLKARVDSISNASGSDWFQIGGAGVAYGTYTKDKNGLVAGETYRGQARAFCDPNGGAYFSLSWTPLVYWTQPTSRIEGGTAIANLAIYPNPSRDVFNISFTSETIQDLKIRILNVVGEVIISKDLDQFVGEYTKQISLHENAKGIYFLEIETNDGVVNKKLILQ